MSESSVKTIQRNNKTKTSDVSSNKNETYKKLINGNHESSENSIHGDDKKKEITHERAFDQLQNHPFSRKCVHSLLSSQSDIQNYRGFLNVAGIILIVTNFRLVVENLLKYGILIDSDVFKSYYDWSLITWLSSLPVFALISLIVERYVSKNLITEKTTLIIHMINLSLSMLVPCTVVLLRPPSPFSGIILLMASMITFLKLTSFVMANRQFRLDLKNKKENENFKEKDLVNCDELVVYPNNLTVKNLAYFFVAPTLCYQINYPRTKEIRWYWLTGKFLQFIFFIALVFFMIEQWCFPVVKNSVDFFKTGNIMGIAERVMKLSIPSLYIWLAIFYSFFHLWLNILAELLKFGDREFYGDWYNSTTIGYYWRKWNIPTHNWLVRHVYYPAIRKGYSKTVATSLVFLFSAIFHEIVISVPLHTFKFYFFLGMILQIPAMYLGKYFEHSVIGNIIFWIGFCFFGQPIGILLYYQDYISQ